jgi:hypothetical protein
MMANCYIEYADADAKVIEYCSASKAQRAQRCQERFAGSRNTYITRSDANLSGVNTGLPGPYETLVTVSDALPMSNEQ